MKPPIGLRTRVSRLRWKIALAAMLATMATILAISTVYEIGAMAQQDEPIAWMSMLARLIVRIPGTLVSLLPLGLLVGAASGIAASRSLVNRFERLRATSMAWSRGTFDARVADSSPDELGELSRSLDAMAGQLERLLSTRAELATVDERNRMARELHDTVKQQVFSIGLYLASVEALLHQDKAAAASKLSEARRLCSQAGHDLNALILALRPAALQDRGLAAALDEHLIAWSGRNDATTELRVSGNRELPLDLEQELFRVAQEALANVARHAQARSVSVALAIDPEQVQLTIEDDGIGFAPDDKSPGSFGLTSMHERLLSLGGRLEVTSRKGCGGSTIIAACPLPSGVEG